MSTLSEKRAFIFLLLVCTLTTLPFLGLTYFNTKGEPREAIVAYSMIDTGDWTLPRNNGGETAYKPPFFHWCIAAVSQLTGGKVTEYTSRFPSALSAIIMIIAGFFFYSKRKSYETALIASLTTFTAFEVHRAIFACRVDMVLTFCIVCALYCLLKWTEKECKHIPWLAILLMSAGTLTKGPVAIILPCGVTGAYLLVRGWNFWQALWRLALIAIASLIIPIIWYYAAYRQGGEEFLQLVKEENIDRFTGKMSYSSHENPWTYNIITMVAGFLPWTLALFISLFSLRYKKPQSRPAQWAKRTWNNIRNIEPVRLFSMLAIIIIFIFYCIPKSKRSVYLLPVYPFTAYFIAEYLLWLFKKHTQSIKIYGYIIAGISALIVLTFIAVKTGIVPESIFKGKHAYESIGYMHALQQIPVLGWGIIGFVPLVGLFTWYKQKNIASIIIMTLLLYLSLDTIYQPAILNKKSDKQVAEKIKEICPNGPIESFVDADMMHYFTINFYNGNRVGTFKPGISVEGYLLIGDKDDKSYLAKNEGIYDFKLVYDSGKRSCDTKQIIRLYKYKMKQ